jgi:gamma-glutamyltranspeptidase/glutathione hydrolase
MSRAATYPPGQTGAAGPPRDFAARDLGDTIYLTAADEQGTWCPSSNHSLPGSALASLRRTGITLHNRGSGSCSRRVTPNQIAPRKRPLHTLIRR